MYTCRHVQALNNATSSRRRRRGGNDEQPKLRSRRLRPRLCRNVSLYLHIMCVECGVCVRSYASFGLPAKSVFSCYCYRCCCCCAAAAVAAINHFLRPARARASHVNPIHMLSLYSISWPRGKRCSRVRCGELMNFHNTKRHCCVVFGGEGIRHQPTPQWKSHGLLRDAHLDSILWGGPFAPRCI